MPNQISAQILRPPQNEVGAVERKLQTFPQVEGQVFGNWGEASG